MLTIVKYSINWCMNILYICRKRSRRTYAKLLIVVISRDGTIRTFFERYFIYLFLERGKGGRKRGRETSICGCLSRGPHWGPGLQPRHVPWLGIELVTLWFTARAQSTELYQPGRLELLMFFLLKNFTSIYVIFVTRQNYKDI